MMNLNLYPQLFREITMKKNKGMYKQVTKFTYAIDLLEPFNRIRVALDTLSAQDKRFS